MPTDVVPPPHPCLPSDGAPCDLSASLAAIQSGVDPAVLERDLAGVVSEEMERRHLVGAVVVDRESVILAEEYGHADLEQQTPVRPEYTFRAASVSKLFTTTAVMQLVERGQIELDRELEAYIHGVEFPRRDGKPITPRHLLTHSAGLSEGFIGSQARTRVEWLTLRDYLAGSRRCRGRCARCAASANRARRGRHCDPRGSSERSGAGRRAARRAWRGGGRRRHDRPKVPSSSRRRRARAWISFQCDSSKASGERVYEEADVTTPIADDEALAAECAVRDERVRVVQDDEVDSVLGFEFGDPMHALRGAARPVERRIQEHGQVPIRIRARRPVRPRAEKGGEDTDGSAARRF